MKRFVLFFLIISIILFGCAQKDISEMDPEDLPDVRSFQDEFTRGFMGALDEIEDGYYLFQSKTEGYSMMFPENAMINPFFYTRSDKYSEQIDYQGDKDPINQLDYLVRAYYNNSKRSSTLSVLLEVLSDDVRYDGDYHKRLYDDKTIYHSAMTAPHKMSDAMDYFIFGLVHSNKTNQYVNFIYSVDCIVENDECKIDKEPLNDHVLKLMESIEFHDEE